MSSWARCIKAALRLLGFSLLVAIWPHALAQSPGKVYRVGLLANTIPAKELETGRIANPAPRIIEDGLRELGWINGKNIQLIWRTVESKYERYPRAIDELIRLQADVIVVFSPLAADAARRRTPTIPIVHASHGPLMPQKVIQSLARPGTNVTGISGDVFPDLNGKRLALLKAAVPKASRVAVLQQTIEPQTPPFSFSPNTQAAADRLGLTLFAVPFMPGELDEAFARAVKQGANAMLVGGWSELQYPDHQLPIHELARQYRMPVMHTIPSAVESGGLLGYGFDVRDSYRAAPHYIDKILRGAKPGDLPLLQPDKLEFVVNLNAARAIGLTIPTSVLTQAERIIQ